MTRIPALGPRGEGWVAAQMLLIGIVAVRGTLALPDAIDRWPDNWPFVVQGFVLLGIGGWATVSGANRLGGSLTAVPRPRDGAELVESGIYARIRHPIYLGVMCLGIGWALLCGDLVALVAACVLAVVLDLKARREEVWLLERYPAYEAYRARTRRFVPGVY